MISIKIRIGNIWTKYEVGKDGVNDIFIVNSHNVGEYDIVIKLEGGKQVIYEGLNHKDYIKGEEE